MFSVVSFFSYGLQYGEEGEVLGDVYMWGEGVGDGILGGGVYRLGSVGVNQLDVFFLKILEFIMVLDV